MGANQGLVAVYLFITTVIGGLTGFGLIIFGLVVFTKMPINYNRVHSIIGGKPYTKLPK